MHEYKKILVVRLSSLGDIILSFPLLEILRKKIPEAEIHFLTGKKFSEVISLNKNIDRIIETDTQLSITKNKVQDEKYDLILDIQKNFKSKYITKNSSAEVRRIVKNSLEKFILVKFRKNIFKKIIPVYKKYLMTINDLIDESEMEFTISELKLSGENNIDFPYAVISPSSRHFTKTYPAEKFIEFIKSRESETFILTGSKEKTDIEICRKIKSECNNTVNLCGELSISELASLIKRSEYVICNDSAVLHLSEALDKKTYAIFGSTVKEFGFFPQLRSSEVLEVKGLKCRPCSHIGLPKCPEKHFMCMMETDLKNYKLK